MTADFRFIAHAAQRHTHVLTSGGFGDGLAERFYRPRRPNQAQDRPFELVNTALHREVLKNTILHALEAVVVGVEDLLSLTQVFLTLLRAFHGTCTIQSM